MHCNNKNELRVLNSRKKSSIAQSSENIIGPKVLANCRQESKCHQMTAQITIHCTWLQNEEFPLKVG